MGVITEAKERDAQGRPASTTTGSGEPQDPQAPDVPVDLPENIDPFIQRYATQEFKMDSDALNQMLTGVIAVANVF